MKQNAIIRIVLFSITILVLLGILLAGIGARYYMTAFHTSGISDIVNFAGMTGGTVAASGRVDASAVRQIEIDWAAGSITIVPGDTDRIEFAETEVKEEKYRMVWKQSGDKLQLRFCENAVRIPNFSLGSGGDLSKDLVVTVPRDWTCDGLELNVASALVSINGLTIKSVDFNGASGTLTLDNCDVSDLDIDTASGEIRFSGTLDVLDCDAVSASCTAILNNTPKSINMDSVSGDLNLTLPEDCGFTANMDTLSGGFTSDFATTATGKHHVHGDGSCRISVSGVSGDIVIRKCGDHPQNTDHNKTHHPE